MQFKERVKSIIDKIRCSAGVKIITLMDIRWKDVCKRVALHRKATLNSK